MNESTLVPREEMSDLDWLARNVHVWPSVTPKIYPAGCKEFTNGAIFHDEYMILDHDIEITKDQWHVRRTELQNKPKWVLSPEWSQWLAQDEDGVWYWHGEEPNSNGEDVNGCCYWMSRGISDIARRGELLGDWRDTLEKRPADLSEEAVTSRLKKATDNVLAAVPELMDDKYKFEPFVSVEDAATANKRVTLAQLIVRAKRITPSKYTKTIHGVSVDVYDVLQAWGVSNPALQHLIKKALQCGQRGHKDNAQDLQDIIDSAIRAKELEC